MQRAGLSADTLAAKNKSLARTYSRSIKNAIATVAFTALARQAISFSADFDKAMNDVAAKSGATAMQLKEMRELAKDLGSTTAFSASQAAEGMTFLAQAGLDANESIKALPNVLDLAQAGNLSLAQSADIATNCLLYTSPSPRDGLLSRMPSSA